MVYALPQSDRIARESRAIAAGAAPTVHLEARDFPWLPAGLAGLWTLSMVWLAKRVCFDAGQRRSPEDWARRIAQNVFGVVFSLDQEGRVTYISPAIEEMTGYRSEEIVGAHFNRFIPPSETSHAMESLARVIRGDSVQALELQVFRKDGSLAVVEISGVPAFNEESGSEAYGIIRDITERRRFEETLCESKRKLATLMGNLPGMVYRCRDDAHWTMEFVSDGCFDLTGYRPEELLGNCWVSYADLIHPEDREIVSARVREAVARRERFQLEYRIRTASGAEKWLWGQGSGVFSDSGELQALEGLTIDISDRRRAQASLAQAKEEAEAANRAKSEFLTSMSYEIRTPMTAVLGYLDLLTEGCARTCSSGREEFAAFSQIISQNARQLLELTSGILDLSRIESGRLSVQNVDCSPGALAAEVVHLLRPRADAKQLSLSIHYDTSIPETISSDPFRIRQILVTLLDNAIKFTQAGEVRVVLRLNQEPPSAPLLEIAVIDTGVGISDQQMATLFQSSSQDDASTTRDPDGTGLGLTISSRLARLLGGEIQATSANGRGSRFVLSLPVGALEGIAMVSHPAAAQAAGDARPNEDRRSSWPHDCRILVAEDSPDGRRMLQLLLESTGFEITTAENGRSAVDLAQASREQGRPFDLILMDIQMPVMDGYQATRQLRETRWPGPIVALTANAMIDDRRKCLEAGCDDYIAKPVNRKRLLNAIARHITPLTAEPSPTQS
jgi:PAS domain S-box-containing protein